MKSERSLRWKERWKENPTIHVIAINIKEIRSVFELPVMFVRKTAAASGEIQIFLHYCYYILQPDTPPFTHTNPHTHILLTIERNQLGLRIL